MSKSILQKEKKCFYCGALYGLENHHVFGGPLRKLSEHWGLKVWLCHRHHNEPPEGVHHNREKREELQDFAQRMAMKVYGWDIDDFREIFMRNYLLEEEE